MDFTHSSIVALLTFSVFHLFSVGIEGKTSCDHVGVSPGVLALEVGMHEHTQTHAHGDRSNKETMAREVPRSIFATEREASNNTSEVTEADVHGNTNSSLGSTADVVPVPCNTQRNVGVNSVSHCLAKCEGLNANNIPRDDEEGADILDVGFVCRNQHDKPDNGDDAEAYHVWSTLLGPVGQESSGDSNDTAENIGRNAHQLRLVVGVAHVFDDGGEEEGN